MKKRFTTKTRTVFIKKLRHDFIRTQFLQTPVCVVSDRFAGDGLQVIIVVFDYIHGMFLFKDGEPGWSNAQIRCYQAVGDIVDDLRAVLHHGRISLVGLSVETLKPDLQAAELVQGPVEYPL